MSDLAFSLSAIAPAALPRLSAMDMEVPDRRSMPVAPNVELDLSPAGERILELMALDNNAQGSAGSEGDLPAAMGAGQATARAPTDVADGQMVAARPDPATGIDETDAIDGPASEVLPARSAEASSIRANDAVTTDRAHLLAEEIANVAAAAREKDDALAEPARLADLLEQMHAVRPDLPRDGTVLAGEAFPLPQVPSPAASGDVPGPNVPQAIAPLEATGGLDPAVAPTGSRPIDAPEGTLADGGQRDGIRTVSRPQDSGSPPEPNAANTPPENDVALADPSLDESPSLPRSTASGLAEQAPQTGAGPQGRIEEQAAVQVLAEHTSDREADEQRAQEASLVNQFFEELAATRIATRLVARLEADDAAGSEAADAAAQDQSRADETARTAAQATTAVDDSASPMRVADLLERMNLTRPAAAVPDTLEAGEAFPLPSAVPGALDTADERPATRDTRPAPVPFEVPEAARPTPTETQAGFRAAEQDAAVYRARMFMDVSLMDGRPASPSPSEPEISYLAPGKISPAAAIQASTGQADSNGRSRTPGDWGLVGAPSNDETRSFARVEAYGQALDLSV